MFYFSLTLLTDSCTDFIYQNRTSYLFLDLLPPHLLLLSSLSFLFSFLSFCLSFYPSPSFLLSSLLLVLFSLLLPPLLFPLPLLLQSPLLHHLITPFSSFQKLLYLYPFLKINLSLKGNVYLL